MKPLVDDMVQEDPSKRPHIDEVVRRFNELIPTLSWWKLRSRLVDLEIPSFLSPMHHFFRTILHVLTFRHPIPRA